MKIGIRVIRHIVIDNNIYSFDINTSSEDVGCNHDSSFEVLEDFVSVDSRKLNKYL